MQGCWQADFTSFARLHDLHLVKEGESIAKIFLKVKTFHFNFHVCFYVWCFLFVCFVFHFKMKITFKIVLQIWLFDQDIFINTPVPLKTGGHLFWILLDRILPAVKLVQNFSCPCTQRVTETCIR